MTALRFRSPIFTLASTRTAVVVRGGADPERSRRSTQALGSALGCSVMVIGISSLHWAVREGAAGTGLITLAAIDDAALEEAAKTARHLATILPSKLEVRHVACPGWNAPFFIEALRAHRFDTVFLISRPGWRNRAALVRAAGQGGTQVIFGTF